MDAAVIRFTTALFDVSKERPNPINPIFGETLLHWLAAKLKDRVSFTTPDAEDWGWYSTVEWNGRGYMLGSSASDEETGGTREWILQIVKQRSAKERLLGREKMAADDACVELILEVLRTESGFVGIALD